MKSLFFLIILGVSEVVVIGQLHSIFGLYTLIGLYVISTAIGGILLYVRYPEFKRSMKASKNLGKKFKNKISEKEHALSTDQLKKFPPLLFIARYGIAVGLIIAPGIVSDLVGIAIILPVVTSFFINRKIDKEIVKAGVQP
ncbi:FxsA family protein [Gilvimarinus agarilyticus]|uniref:FxsA family protein n=1 Tax=Gilvimarinus sp. 2_MG-2023 TaxID=3062666 RepID=UPI001C081EEF|nr:FxsA family protein [Gilvimarinus sp. 2_MG-2023]MBU2885500.1 FxsA family protein [Gilvimarinus agarilyticus]MDO6570400.1 FxsA family protein [Gilvimarinus sp. 2_MG-2023]